MARLVALVVLWFLGWLELRTLESVLVYGKVLLLEALSGHFFAYGAVLGRDAGRCFSFRILF